MELRSREDVVAFLHGRTFIYELGHTVFGGQPSEGLLEALRSDALTETVVRLASQIDGLTILADYLATLRDDDVLSIEFERSVSDYQRVVLGLGASNTAHPWESYYTNSKQLLFQVETLEVRTAYREFGYLPAHYPKVADDHVALECAFMAELAKRTIEALEECAARDGSHVIKLLDGQLRFVRDHLSKWIGLFSADMSVDCPDGLYGIVAETLARFLSFDALSLESALTQVVLLHAHGKASA